MLIVVRLHSLSMSHDVYSTFLPRLLQGLFRMFKRRHGTEIASSRVCNFPWSITHEEHMLTWDLSPPVDAASEVFWAGVVSQLSFGAFF